MTCGGGDSAQLEAIGARLRDGVGALERAVQFVVSTYGTDVRKASVGAVPFLELFGTVAGGWQMGRAALAAHRRLSEGQGDAGFHRAKLCTARFYADHVLARAPGLATTVWRARRAPWPSRTTSSDEKPRGRPAAPDDLEGESEPGQHAGDLKAPRGLRPGRPRSDFSGRAPAAALRCP